MGFGRTLVSTYSLFRKRNKNNMFTKAELESILVLISSVTLKVTDANYDENHKVLTQLRDKCKEGLDGTAPDKTGKGTTKTAKRRTYRRRNAHVDNAGASEQTES